jgi:hypothetical protein
MEATCLSKNRWENDARKDWQRMKNKTKNRDSSTTEDPRRASIHQNKATALRGDKGCDIERV